MQPNPITITPPPKKSAPSNGASDTLKVLFWATFWIVVAPVLGVFAVVILFFFWPVLLVLGILAIPFLLLALLLKR